MSGRQVSAAEAFIDAVEELCVHKARLEQVTEAAAALHDASALATAGTETLARLLHVFRARAGSRSAEWWIATLEGSKATALPSELMLDLLVVKPMNTWPGLIIVLAGIPVYFFWKLTGKAASGLSAGV